ncbi:MAG: DUF5718 family protein, partial [Campylobacterota bacterium]|nr:DUF5718 family protein [Campylobacterota bacterium]
MLYRDVLGCGIAGNFALHLEQAGESADFKDLVVDDPNGPKGIFPFYLKGFKTQLGTYPLSSTQITLPTYEANIQAEPEVALLCELSYTDNIITSVAPIEAFAYNDCSIRREGATKISQKKNWGENSKGISANSLKLNTFSKGGTLESYRIASFLRRDDELHVYGEDVEVSGYSYFNEKLTSWIMKQLNEQIDTGPLEPISEYIKECNYP